MRTTVEFLDAVKARHQLTSDYQLARFLGVRQQTISSYRRGNSRLDEGMAIKVADALELDHAHVLATIAAERAKTDPIKKAWQRAAAATAAVVLAVLAVQFALMGESGDYWTISAFAGAMTLDPLYIIRISGFALLALLVSHLAHAQGERHDLLRRL